MKRLMNIEKDVAEVTDERRLQWFRDVMRMEDGRMLKELMKWPQEEINRKGRPTEKLPG